MLETVCSPEPKWMTFEKSKIDGYTRWTLFLFASRMPFSWKHKYRLIVSITF